MRKSTGRALRISFTGVGVAALGVAFAGSASAAELPGGVLGGNESTDSTGDAGFYDSGSQTSGPLSAADSVTNMAGAGSVDNTAGGVTGAAGLDSFQMPVSNHTQADGDDHNLPIVSLAGIDQVTEDNNLLNGALSTGLDTPGITGLKIPLFD